MAQQLAEVEKIATNPDAPTFENTLVELEKTGALLSRTASAFYAVSGANTNPYLQQLQQDIAPKLSAHSDAINLDPRLFARVKAVYDQRATLKLDAESDRLLEITYDGFVKSGALLTQLSKQVLTQLNTEQSTLQAKSRYKLYLQRLLHCKPGTNPRTEKERL